MSLIFRFDRQLAGSLAVLLCNVKACKVRGAASQARLLRCFGSDGPGELLAPPAGSDPGDRVTFLDYPGNRRRRSPPFSSSEANVSICAGFSIPC